MIEELKKNKANELSIASQKIDTLKYNLNQKQEELVEALNRFEPLLELQRNRPNIEEERRIKIEQSQKTNIAILEVLLDKYGIVSLKPKNRWLSIVYLHQLFFGILLNLFDDKCTIIPTLHRPQ